MFTQHIAGLLNVFSACLQYFTIKMQDGVVATSYANGDKFYIDPMKLLPLDRFLPKPKGSSAGITKGKLPMLSHELLVHNLACIHCPLKRPW